MENEQNPTESDTKSDTPTNKPDNIRPFKQRKTTTKEKKEYMIEVLTNQLGIVMVACKQVGIHRDTHYTWIKKDPKYAKAVANAKLDTKDIGEHYLLKLMKEGNQAATIFFNKTQNKDRGYGDHVEMEHSGKVETNTFNLIVKSEEEIKREKLDNQPKTA